VHHFSSLLLCCLLLISMSLITDDPDESPRHCATKRHHHHHHHGSGCGQFGGTRRRRLLIAASSAATSIIALAIILWLTLRPSAPKFSLLAATAEVVGPNATGISRLDAAFVVHNPNARAAALYDRLQLRASYANVQLAAAAESFEQTQGDVVLSASLSSSSSVDPAATMDVGETAASGRSTLLLRLRVEGHLRWKVAAWVSGRRALVAECVAIVMLQPSQPRAVVVQVQGSQCATTLSGE
jgi:hypothetical protein